MLLRASNEFGELSRAMESSLDKAGIKYIRNGTRNLAEYEIESPVYLRIVIESRSDPVIHNNPILPPKVTVAKGCNVDLRFSFDASRDEMERATELASSILRETISSLGRKKPWEGLGFMESDREKKKWMNLIG